MRELGSGFRVEGLGLRTGPRNITEYSLRGRIPRFSETYAHIIQAMVPHACFAGALEALF